MDSYNFYKSIYDRELKRRNDLDSSVSLPITILTIIAAANSFLISKENIVIIKYELTKMHLFYFLVFISFSISIFYLTRSYNNLFKGFAYRNLGKSKEIRDFEINKIREYNIQVQENEKLNFENILIEKINDITDDLIIFNDRRSLDLYKARTYIIITLFLTAINFLIFTIKYLIQ